MAYMNDSVFDSGLSWAISNGVQLNICSAEPTTYAEATATYSLGVQTGITLDAISNGASSGRKTSIPAITAGTVNTSGSAAYWALTDGASILVATGALLATQTVTAGNTFSLDATTLTIADAT